MSSDDEVLNSVNERLERLERQNRRWRSLAIVAVLAVGALVLTGATRSVPLEIAAHKFVLVGPDGKTKAELVSVGGPGAVLRFVDATGKPRAVLTSNGYAIFGHESEKFGSFSTPVSRVSLSRTGLYLNNRDGMPAIILGGVKNIRTSEGRNTAEPELTLFGTAGRTRVDIGVRNSTGPYVTLLGGNGKPRAWMWLKGNSPQFGVGTAKSFETIIGGSSLVTPLTGETHRTSAASIVMLGKGGSVIWQAP